MANAANNSMLKTQAILIVVLSLGHRNMASTIVHPFFPYFVWVSQTETGVANLNLHVHESMFSNETIYFCLFFSEIFVLALCFKLFFVLRIVYFFNFCLCRREKLNVAKPITFLSGL